MSTSLGGGTLEERSGGKMEEVGETARGQRRKVDLERKSLIQGGSNVGQSGRSMTVGDGRDGRDVTEDVLMTVGGGRDNGGDERSGAGK